MSHNPGCLIPQRGNSTAGNTGSLDSLVSIWEIGFSLGCWYIGSSLVSNWSISWVSESELLLPQVPSAGWKWYQRKLGKLFFFFFNLFHLTLFLPAMGGISPYMSSTWPSAVGIGLSQLSKLFQKKSCSRLKNDDSHTINGL